MKVLKRVATANEALARFYDLELHANDDGTYAVMATGGLLSGHRPGDRPRTTTMHWGHDQVKARRLFDELLAAKLAEGYAPERQG